jgi:hypothetical protein
MSERYLGRLRPGMDVCDVAGDKVGTISHVYRHADAVVGAGGSSTTVPSAEPPTRDEIIEVKTGFLGLGHHYYIPVSAIQDALEESVFLAEPKSAFDRLGWHNRPDYLDELQ